jgi:hypothetical protein
MRVIKGNLLTYNPNFQHCDPFFSLVNLSLLIMKQSSILTLMFPVMDEVSPDQRPSLAALIHDRYYLFSLPAVTSHLALTSLMPAMLQSIFWTSASNTYSVVLINIETAELKLSRALLASAKVTEWQKRCGSLSQQWNCCAVALAIGIQYGETPHFSQWIRNPFKETHQALRSW